MAPILSDLVIKEWKRAIIAPSYSFPISVLTEMVEKAFQTMVSQILVAMKREIPDPSPYPFYNISSSKIIIYPAKVSWIMIRIAFPAPTNSISPYIPE
jgi:hypothetical protein